MTSEKTKQYRLSRVHAKKKRVQRVSRKEWDEYHKNLQKLESDPQLWCSHAMLALCAQCPYSVPFDETEAYGGGFTPAGHEHRTVCTWTADCIGKSPPCSQGELDQVINESGNIGSGLGGLTQKFLLKDDE